MTEPFTLAETILLAFFTGLIPAIISGLVTYSVAQANFKRELQKVEIEFARQQRGQIASLRQQYIIPLRYYAITLSKRFAELEAKHTHADYDRVRGWFQQIKDHADGRNRMREYPVWCCYEGIFSMTTLYYTCSYFQCAREVRARAPFSELDPAYSGQLDGSITKVSDAFAWSDDGIWHPSQEVIGERFTRGDAKIEYEELCRIMDSGDDFKYAPFFRPIDVYIKHLDRDRAKAIRLALDDLVRFIDSRPTPEKAA